MRFREQIPVLDVKGLSQILSGHVPEEAEGIEKEYEVQLGCDQHQSDGVFVYYEHGVLILVCTKCNSTRAQIEVAKEGSMVVGLAQEGMD